MEENKYIKFNWEEYKEMLKKYEYTDEQIEEVKKIRENPEMEEISWEQFRFLFIAKVIKRTRKLKKIRTLFTDGDKVYYLDHYNKSYDFCGYFINEE